MATLKWKNINFDDNTIKIIRDETFNPKGRSKKNRKPKEHIIPTSIDVAEMLKSLPRSSKYIFLKDGKPIDREEKSFKKWIIAIVRGTELEGMIRFHGLRHITGDIPGNAGWDIFKIKEFFRPQRH